MKYLMNYFFYYNSMLVKSNRETHLSRQITPRTNIGHAPPIIQS
jgi:hypothetical protein